MDIKVLATKESIPKRYVIGTHNGIFHADEVVATALLCLLNSDRDIRVIRTRDTSILNTCDIVVDVGGGKYDHHQPGGNGKRENGIPYASAGLVWNDFGNSLTMRLSFDAFHRYDIDPIWSACKSIDEDIISKVDMEDNGIESGTHMFNFINSFLPNWTEGNNADYDAAFAEVLDIVIKLLKKEIVSRVSKAIATAKIVYCCSNASKDGILELPCQTIPWAEEIVKWNNSISKTLLTKHIVYFVIFPYPDGGWAAQCVPPSLEDKFSQLIPFPKKWAGQTIMLPTVSGVEDATFCHNGRFFAKAKSKEGIISLCQKAIELHNAIDELIDS